QPRQLALDVLVAAVEVVDAVDGGFAIGDQAGKDQRGRCTQVGRHHRGAAEAGNAGHGGTVALDMDLRAQARQLLHVHEAVLEDRLVEDADAFGDAVHRHELRLHVGGKAGMRRGDDVHRPGPTAAHVDGDGITAAADVGTGLDQLVEHRI